MRVSGALLATALVAGCGDDPVCHLTECGNSCIDTTDDVNNCGGCGTTCDTGETCSDSQCVVQTGQCEAPMTACGTDCVDLTSDHDNCGDCGHACNAFGTCSASACDEPILAVQTGRDGPEGSVIGRDAFTYSDKGGLKQISADTGFEGDRVLEVQTTKDGHVVYVADELVEGVFDLMFAAPDGSTAPVRLSNDDNRTVQPGFVVSADGSKVLYRAADLTTGEIDLFAASVAAPGAAVQVNGALVAGGTVTRAFAVTADGTRATYVADEDTAGHREVYTVDLSGATPGAATKLNPTITGTVADFVMKSDGALVVYRADADATGVPSLFVVQTATPGTAVAIPNTTEPTYHAIQGYQLLEAANTLFYTGGAVTFQESLWAVPLDNLPLDSQLVQASTGGIDMVRPDFVITEDGFAFFRQHDPTSGLMSLFGMNLDILDATPVPVRINDDASSPVSDFALSKNHQQIVFRVGGDGPEGGDTSAAADFDAIHDLNDEQKIFVVETDLSVQQAPVLIANDANNGVQPGYTSLDDGRVVFRADLDTVGQEDLFVCVVGDDPTAIAVTFDDVDPAGATDVASVVRF